MKELSCRQRFGIFLTFFKSEIILKGTCMDNNIKFDSHSVPIGKNIGTFLKKNYFEVCVGGEGFMGVPWGGI